MTAHIAIPVAACEALCLFLADRAELWAIHAQGCGVTDPTEVPRQLAKAHAEAVQSAQKETTP